MIISMALVTIHTVRNHPGSTIEEIAQFIYEKLPIDNWTARCLLADDNAKLRELLDEDLAPCIEQKKDGKYYLKSNPKKYHRFAAIDFIVTAFLKQEEQAAQDNASKK